MDLKSHIREVPDFPQLGVSFKDITPLLQDPEVFLQVMDRFHQYFAQKKVDDVVAIESRGFIFGAPLAIRLNAGFIPIRKKGKLPRKTVGVSYDLEYGRESVELHEDAFVPGRRILIVDDVLATGGTATAARKLVQDLGGVVAGMAVLIELDFAKGREKLPGIDICSLVHY